MAADAHGFVHDTEHALLAPFAVGEAMEVVFPADFSGQFDQAGLFVRAGAVRRMKCGVEFADHVLGRAPSSPTGCRTGRCGAVRCGAVRCRTGPVARCACGRAVGPDALVVRGGVDDEPLRLLRVAPFPAELDAQAGPFVCAPDACRPRGRIHRMAAHRNRRLATLTARGEDDAMTNAGVNWAGNLLTRRAS